MPFRLLRSRVSPAQRQVDAQLQTLASVRRPFVAYLPDLSLLRVRDAASGDALVYTIVHDKAHKNVAFMFGEQSRRLADRRYLTILSGYYGSYPNFFFECRYRRSATSPASCAPWTESRLRGLRRPLGRAP